MRFSVLLLSSIAPAFIAAHGKIAAVQGDAGGNGTAIGIQGGIIPGAGKNKVTEPDTTIFGSTKVATNGLGKTKGQGKNTVAMVADTMEQSGSTLPQVSDGGMITGTFHIVTTDGAGPVSAMIDTTGTGAFSTGVQANVMQDVPGNKGNIKANGQVPRSLEHWALRARGLVKRASNVNQDYPIAVQVPAGTTCSGTVAGQQNVCFMKIANSNKAGPFGGVIAFQMSDGSSSDSSSGSAVAKRFVA
ncbi:cell surface protein [Macroventuria anomochaeta]|uniref:Cell surface protein n=1 Tax=Macroventuria anomochaeta TaxID=301207 RepID=A0ACB6S8U9_9PLEO|nr:cell surface protein [Macroventuria anomochaeta]KAF2630484.1 cell surface protein [Macroventuria anomochaeta]